MSAGLDDFRAAGLDPASHVLVYPFKGRPCAVVVLGPDAPHFVFYGAKGEAFVRRFVGSCRDHAAELASRHCRWVPPGERAGLIAAACGEGPGFASEAVH